MREKGKNLQACNFLAIHHISLKHFIFNLPFSLPLKEARLCSTLCANYIPAEHLNTLDLPTLFFVFTIKPAFSSYWKRGCDYEVDNIADSVKKPEIHAVELDT